MTRYATLTVSLLLAATALGRTAAAQPYATSDYDTGHMVEIFGVEDFDYDTDWIPAGSPIQVRLTVHVGNTVSIEMPGEADYDWDLQEIGLYGDPAGGLFEMDMGLTAEALVRFDILNIQWEGNIGDPLEFWLHESGEFTPYLLPGNPDRPAELHPEIPKQNVIDYQAVDILVASVSVKVDISGVVDTAFMGTQVEVTPLDGGPATVIDENDTLFDLDFADGEGPAEAEAQLEGDIMFLSTISMWPSVVVNILGTDYDLLEFEVPLPLPEVNDTWTFEPELLSFERPPPGDDDDVVADDDDNDDQVTDPDSENAEGCNCDVEGRAGNATPALAVLLALLVWRGRRTRTH